MERSMPMKQRLSEGRMERAGWMNLGCQIPRMSRGERVVSQEEYWESVVRMRVKSRAGSLLALTSIWMFIGDAKVRILVLAWLDPVMIR